MLVLVKMGVTRIMWMGMRRVLGASIAVLSVRNMKTSASFLCYTFLCWISLSPPRIVSSVMLRPTVYPHPRGKYSFGLGISDAMHSLGYDAGLGISDCVGAGPLFRFLSRGAPTRTLTGYVDLRSWVTNRDAVLGSG